ncbi:MAG: hypothetical protein HOJ06_04770, partial [Rhodospirillaceae bacterium]|nr:hypothetical protein [Rhodospirillaceae bacterium]
YVIVIGEIALLPLTFGHLKTAVVFTGLNAVILTWRIHVENKSLSERKKACCGHQNG